MNDSSAKVPGQVQLRPGSELVNFAQGVLELASGVASDARDRIGSLVGYVPTEQPKTASLPDANIPAAIEILAQIRQQLETIREEILRL